MNCSAGGCSGLWGLDTTRACRTSPSPRQPLSASCAPVPADPPPQLVPVSNVTVSPGETAILSCLVLSEAPYNLTWVRDWRVLSASTGRVTQLADLSLEVRNTTPSDGGRYQCMASNSNGVARASVWLLVRGEAAHYLAFLQEPIHPSLCSDISSGRQYQPFQSFLNLWSKRILCSGLVLLGCSSSYQASIYTAVGQANFTGSCPLSGSLSTSIVQPSQYAGQRWDPGNFWKPIDQICLAGFG